MLQPAVDPAGVAEKLGKAFERIDESTTVSRTPEQRVAHISFIDYGGPAAFRNSTFLKKLTQGVCNGQFHWIKAGERVLPGLVIRRNEER
ncbi:glycoside hydrolase family protein [Modicisalibacter luteus]|uniref:glycoside hydrolase family protein n=1 Tax=Modicisalibacter luteus TaxID=453962 RepID=UPI00362F3608